MDGIDGMTSMETIFLCLSLALVFYLTDVQGSYIYVALLLAGCTLGFAKHNWHPAKMFMGDAGSISIGFIIATLLGIWAAKGYLLQAAILPMYYFADAGVVLFFRIINLEKFWLPHSKHFFQRAVRSGFTHSQVVLKIFKYNCGVLGFCLISMWFKMINLCFLEYSIVILAMLYCYHLTKMLRMGNIIK
jgi:UDP-N-acetylmuramyl pentapeptide phosphotransferase/UDP-N-acetylglucosamine-1-phosphate transferase